MNRDSVSKMQQAGQGRANSPQKFDNRFGPIKTPLTLLRQFNASLDVFWVEKLFSYFPRWVNFGRPSLVPVSVCQHLGFEQQ